MTPAATTAKVAGVLFEHGSWHAFCSCGWLEVGWPNRVSAVESLTAHQQKFHPQEIPTPD
jgi:hypothetical protein